MPVIDLPKPKPKAQGDTQISVALLGRMKAHMVM